MQHCAQTSFGFATMNGRFEVVGDIIPLMHSFPLRLQMLKTWGRFECCYQTYPTHASLNLNTAWHELTRSLCAGVAGQQQPSLLPRPSRRHLLSRGLRLALPFERLARATQNKRAIKQVLQGRLFFKVSAKGGKKGINILSTHSCSFVRRAFFGPGIA